MPRIGARFVRQRALRLVRDMQAGRSIETESRFEGVQAASA